MDSQTLQYIITQGGEGGLEEGQEEGQEEGWEEGRDMAL